MGDNDSPTFSLSNLNMWLCEGVCFLIPQLAPGTLGSCLTPPGILYCWPLPKLTSLLPDSPLSYQWTRPGTPHTPLPTLQQYIYGCMLPILVHRATEDGLVPPLLQPLLAELSPAPQLPSIGGRFEREAGGTHHFCKFPPFSFVSLDFMGKLL